MLGPNADEVLRIVGKEPSAQGIIEPAAMPGAIRALEQAIAREQSKPRPAEDRAAAEGPAGSEGEGVSLRQRAWPLLEMMKRAYAQNEPIVWGV